MFPGIGNNLTAPGTPWILYGGSLAGGEVAFSMKTYGDIFFGGIASSAPIQAVLEYPEW
jgi:Serine carboxypeptidase S28